MALKFPKDQVVVDEIADFRTILEGFQSGQLPESAFQKRRLWQGIYGQRQMGVQMIRIKVPYGVADTAMMRSMGQQARLRSNGILHITTRQAIQIHHIPRGETGDLIDDLATDGLTSREACGNTVRALSGDYFAGIGIDQVFDFRQVADRVFLHCLRNPYSQNFPRKFKIAFSGSDSDRGLTSIHDIGFIATERDGVRGFRVVAGGGLGAQPISAETVEEFLSISEVLIATTALMRLFNAHGNRAQRMKARMKYVKEKWGIVKFREVYRGLFDELAASEYGKSLLLDPATLALDVEQTVSSKDGLSVAGASAQWVSESVEAQRGQDLFSVKVRVPLGDLHADVVDKLCDLADQLGSGEIRLTPDQNVVIPSIARANLSAVHAGLSALDLANPRFRALSNVLACPGRSTCNLSMTSSKGLAKAISDLLEKQPELDVKGSTIKISGCPNSCGHHHIATIGFHGLALRAGGGKSAPYAQMMLGGGADEGIRRIGRRSIRISTKKAPQAVAKIVETWKAEGAGKTLDDFLLAFPDDRLKELMAPFSKLPSYEEEPEAFRDWESDEDYNPAMGQGECAGGVLDLINEALQDALNTQKMARQLIEGGFWTDAAKNAREAVGHVFRAGLSNAGEVSVDWQTDFAVWRKFYGSNKSLPEVADLLSAALPAKLDEAAAREYVAEAGAFVEAVVELYRWKPQQFAPEALADTSTGDRALPLLDLKGVGCPMNYVKVKLKLELMSAGEELEVILDAGEPYRMVPASLRLDGHEITNLEPIENAERYSMVVKKKA
ncbi:MAG: sulfurtransferase TusA family protein [Fibrobacterota bacterium]|nr:sulfurtransferase TusA family protein [Fibrobacterota bacterium]QQS04066.1 MAG: sulfurtransferase TusA family protein [Fibrobacterota bacterium]